MYRSYKDIEREGSSQQGKHPIASPESLGNTHTYVIHAYVYFY
jgi:hypothetical protein